MGKSCRQTTFQDPVIMPLPSPGVRRRFRLVSPFVFRLANGACLELEIPAGFITDFASTPRLLWPLFPPTGPWMRAALVHDYCYREQVPFSRFLADALFREVMRLDGVPRWRRIVFYWAVRLFGWLWWRK